MVVSFRVGSEDNRRRLLDDLSLRGLDAHPRRRLRLDPNGAVDDDSGLGRRTRTRVHELETVAVGAHGWADRSSVLRLRASASEKKKTEEERTHVGESRRLGERNVLRANRSRRLGKRNVLRTNPERLSFLDLLFFVCLLLDLLLLKLRLSHLLYRGRRELKLPRRWANVGRLGRSDGVLDRAANEDLLPQRMAAGEAVSGDARGEVELNLGGGGRRSGSGGGRALWKEDISRREGRETEGRT